MDANNFDTTVTLVRPTEKRTAQIVYYVGPLVLINFSRPLEEKDLQGPASRFHWTEQSKASLTDNGKPRLVNCNRLAAYCPIHKTCWFGGEFTTCPKCEEISHE